MILINSALSVIWKVKIPPDITHHVLPDTEGIGMLATWDSIMFYVCFLLSDN